MVCYILWYLPSKIFCHVESQLLISTGYLTHMLFSSCPWKGFRIIRRLIYAWTKEVVRHKHIPNYAILVTSIYYCKLTWKKLACTDLFEIIIAKFLCKPIALKVRCWRAYSFWLVLSWKVTLGPCAKQVCEHDWAPGWRKSIGEHERWQQAWFALHFNTLFELALSAKVACLWEAYQCYHK